MKLNKKEQNELIQKAIELNKKRHVIKKGTSALKTIELNTPTTKELVEYWHTFGLEGMLQYQIVRIFSLLEFLAKEIDNL